MFQKKFSLFNFRDLDLMQIRKVSIFICKESGLPISLIRLVFPSFIINLHQPTYGLFYRNLAQIFP